MQRLVRKIKTPSNGDRLTDRHMLIETAKIIIEGKKKKQQKRSIQTVTLMKLIHLPTPLKECRETDTFTHTHTHTEFS